jgi:competence protein ComEC
MKFVNVSVLLFSVFLTLGIVAAYLIPSKFHWLPVFPVLLLGLIISWFVANSRLTPFYFFGIITYVSFFFIGYVSYQNRLPKFQPRHYSNVYAGDTPLIIQLKITEVIKADRFSHKYIGGVQAVCGEKVSGKILINVKKDSAFREFSPDAVLLVSAQFQNIAEPLNPYQFNYSQYMQTLGVYHQLHFSNDQILKHSQGSPSLKGSASKLRDYLLIKLAETSIDTNERAIIQALVLGQKKDIDKAIYKEYADAGAVHILAVSGLHVGILFLMLSGLFKPLKLCKRGIYLHSFTVVICLWAFAFISGLSPSVTRAVTMFSFFAFAKVLNRDTNTLNTLFLSYLVLLLFNPLWLFQVGFQLSYLAVLSILMVQPKLHKYYRPRFYIDKMFWSILTVSIAAQIGVIPLSLYYFHQFPGLFFITNLVVLPLLGILVGGGVMIVFLAAFGWLPQIVATGYNFMISSLNSVISLIANQESFIIKDIQFSQGKVIASYLVIFALVILWKEFTYKKLTAAMICFSFLLVVYTSDKYKTSNSEFIIFHKSRKSLLALKHGAQMVLFRSDTNEFYKNEAPVLGYRIEERIRNYSEATIPHVFKFRDNTFLVIDSLGVYPITAENPVIILSGSPKVNLDRLIEKLEPTLIVADGSNYNSYSKRWEQSCKKKKLPFHRTGTKGALIIE